MARPAASGRRAARRRRCCRPPWRPTCTSWAPTRTSRSSSWPASACCAAVRSAPLFGFVAGGLVSLVLFEPLGVSSFVFVIVGYLAGRYAETADLAGVAAPVVTVFAASILGQGLFAITQFLLARQVPFCYVADAGDSAGRSSSTRCWPRRCTSSRAGGCAGRGRGVYTRRPRARHTDARARSAPGARTSPSSSCLRWPCGRRSSSA